MGSSRSYQRRPRLVTAIAALVVGPALAAQRPAVPADEEVPASEKWQWDGQDFVSWLDQARYALDASLRADLPERSGHPVYRSTVGFDARTVLSSESGDLATLLVQGYLERVDAPGVHEWQYFPRQSYLELTGLTRGTINVKAGHFEVPWGLEHTIDTNGTVREVGVRRALGIKADWGIGLNGQLADLEYEAMLGRGSGNEFRSRGDPWILAARAGTPRSGNVVVGLSAFHGFVHESCTKYAARIGMSVPPTAPRARVVRRTRVGVDASLRAARVALHVELAGGRDWDETAMHGLVEAGWRTAAEDLHVYAQARGYRQHRPAGWDDEATLLIGARLSVDARWFVSARVSRALERFASARRDTVFTLQLRVRL